MLLQLSYNGQNQFHKVEWIANGNSHFDLRHTYNFLVYSTVKLYKSTLWVRVFGGAPNNPFLLCKTNSHWQKARLRCSIVH